MVARTAASRLARSSRVSWSSADSRASSAARSGTSLRASVRYCQISASVGVPAEKPATIWRAAWFLVVTSCRSMLVYGGVLGIRHHLLGQAADSWLGEPVDKS